MASQALAKSALWMQNVNYPATWDRTLIDALYASEGVIDGFAVTANGGLGIRVSAGRAVVLGDTVANQGKYLVDSDANVDLTLASVGSNRTEYVWISINDTAVAGGRAGNNVTIETSTTAVPTSALLLATITLTAGTVTITAGMIADNRVYTDVVAAGSVSTAKIADSAITSAKILDGTIATGDIADAAVSTAKIADNAITTAKIAAGAVGTTDIADAAVTTAKLDATLAARLDAIDPADAIIAIAGSTAPTGWGLCDGGAVSRTTYAATFARIGTTYGAGDGSTTFNKPDLRSVFIAGKGTATWSDALNETGGSKDAIVGPHTHTINHGHANTISFTVDGGGGSHAHTEGAETGQGWLYSGAYNGVRYDVFVGSNLSGARSTYGYAQPSTSTAGSTHGHTLTKTGAVTDVTPGTTTAGQSPSTSLTNANLPPYRTLNYAIRLR